MALKFRRGTDAQRLVTTLAEGEPWFSTDTKELAVGDGSTLGGWISSPRFYLVRTISATAEVLASDRGNLIVANSATPIDLDVDLDGISWAAGHIVDICNIGAGTLTIQGGGTTPATINVPATLSAVLSQYGQARLTFISGTTAVLSGGLDAAAP